MQTKTNRRDAQGSVLSAPTIVAWHRTSPDRAKSILTDGFRSAATVSDAIPGVPQGTAGGLAIFKIEVPADVFEKHELMREGVRAYRKAVIPAKELDPLRRELGTECPHCGNWHAGQPGARVRCQDCAAGST